MTEIIEAIDAWTLNRYASHREKLYGFCELITKTAGEGKAPDTFPATIPDRVKVSLDDRFDFITWIRWVSPVTYNPNPEFSWGKSEAREAVQPLRLVLAHRTTLGENLVFDFINNFPSKFEVSGYEHVFVEGSPSIDPDQEGIMLTELNGTGYEKHRFTWNVYVLNITIQSLECVDA